MNLGIYFTLGDLGLPVSTAILKGAAAGGATLLEVGLPFSDPLLDGPVIQASHTRALAQGEIPWRDLCASIHELKSLKQSPQISVMTSGQLLYETARTATLPPVDGLLVTDVAYNAPCPFPLPSPRVWFLSQDSVLKTGKLLPPAENISMVYLTRVQGITGAHQTAESTTGQAIARIKEVTQVPIWLGFGISTRRDLEECLRQGASGGIIGSAFVHAMHEASNKLGPGLNADQRTFELRGIAEKWVKDLLG